LSIDQADHLNIIQAVMKPTKSIQSPMFNHPASILAVLAAAFVTSNSVSAQAIVQWGPSSDYVSIWSNESSLIVGDQVAFSDTVARNPTYDGYPNGLTSGTFYGGAVAEGAAGINLWRVTNNNPNELSFNGYTDSAGQTVTGMYVWNQADFLSGANTGDVTVTSMSANMYSQGASTSSGYARWVIEVSDSQYYVSDAYATARTAAEYSLNDMSSVNWYSMNPNSSMTTISETAWANPEFSAITAVGLWYQIVDQRTSGTSSLGGEGRISSFSAIPEPSAFAMALSGLTLLTTLGVRRIRRR